MKYIELVKTRLTNMRKKISGSRYLQITFLEIWVLLISMLVILSNGGTEYAFDGSDILLYSDGMESSDSRIEEKPEGTHYFITPSVGLGKGIYQVRINYSTDSENNSCDILSYSDSAYSIYSDHVVLSPRNDYVEFDIWANSRLNGVQVKINYSNAGHLEVERVVVKTAWNSSLYLILRLFAVLVLINLLCYLYCHWNSLKADKVVLLGIIGTTVLSSCGLLGEYYTYGHDIGYHLVRIEGLKDGLLSGQFPVRIQPNWLNGWGYPVSVMEGDLTILLPAVLRILGVTVQDAYKCFVLSINFGTAAIAYYCFKKMSGSKYIGLACSVFYTLSIYRMCCIYVRAAVGEYSAMMFLPLIALGLYYAFMEEPTDKGYGKKLLAPVLGFSGLLQTHVLTFRMAAIFIALIILFNIKKVFQKQVFFYLMKIISGSILVNLWFLIPFLKYMSEELNIVTAEFEGRIQRRGITLMELLMPVYNGNVEGSHWDNIVGIGGKFPIALGSTFLIILAVYLMVCGKWNKKMTKKPAGIIFLLAGLSIYMSTNLFPYNAITSFNQELSRLVVIGKLPYRYLAISGLLCTVLTCFVLGEIKDKWEISSVRILTVVLCAIAALQGTSYVYKILFNQEMSIQYDETGLNTGSLLDDEYLYENTNTWVTSEEKDPRAFDLEIISYHKNNTDVILEVKATGPNPAVLVPVLYYVGYEARDMDTGKLFEVSRSDQNNRICVDLPENYAGTLEIKFGKLTIWLVGEIVSLVSIILLIVLAIYYKKKGNVSDLLSEIELDVTEAAERLSNESIQKI